MPDPHIESREEMAVREIGHTKITRPLAAAAAAALLVPLLVSTGLDVASALGAGGGEARRTPPWTLLAELLASLPVVASTASDAGLLAANRELHGAMQRFEDRLEEESALEATVRPPVQAALTGWLGAGTEEAYPGREGWLFFRPGLDSLTAAPFLAPRSLARRAAGGDQWTEPPQPDPVAALRQFGEQLAARGIELVVLPTPIKPTVHAERFSSRLEGSAAPLQNPSFGELVERLEEAGIAIFDPAPLLWRARADTGEAQFLSTDTHWTPAAMDAVAAATAERLRPLLSDGPATVYRRRRTRVENLGDIAVMLGLPAGQTLFAPESVEIERVVTTQGALWRPDPEAEILLLGDSFTNVFSQGALGWGESAGFAEQLSYYLARPVDRLAINAGGSHTTRQALARELAAGRDRLASKRVVVYQFATRELMVGDWKLIELGG